MKASVLGAACVLLASNAAAGPQKDDIRGFRPGMSSVEALNRAEQAGFRCRKMNDLTWISCTNGRNEASDMQWEMYQFGSTAGVVTAVEFRFHSGNRFYSLLETISAQYGAEPHEPPLSQIAEWRLSEDLRLSFRMTGTACVLTVRNNRIWEQARAAEEAERRRINPTPRF